MLIFIFFLQYTNKLSFVEQGQLKYMILAFIMFETFGFILLVFYVSECYIYLS